VLSLSVGSRVKEIAVRNAIGAQRHDILRLILGEGFRLIVSASRSGPSWRFCSGVRWRRTCSR
jgi:putative ABC transport system permease protein